MRYINLRFTYLAYLPLQELIRRDSERELFYDDIVHVEASAYAN